MRILHFFGMLFLTSGFPALFVGAGPALPWVFDGSGAPPVFVLDLSGVPLVFVAPPIGAGAM